MGDLCGVMIGQRTPDGMVLSRLWLVPAAVASQIIAQLGEPDGEQLQTLDQARAGAAAGAGVVAWRDGFAP